MEAITCNYSSKAYQGLSEIMRAAGTVKQQNFLLTQMRSRVMRAHEHLPGNVAVALLTLGDAGTAIVETEETWAGNVRHWNFKRLTPIVAECNPVITSGLQAFQEDMFEMTAYASGAASYSLQLANEHLRDLLAMAGPALLTCKANPIVSTVIMKKVKSDVDAVMRKDLSPVEAILQLKAYLERLKQRAQA